jgi:hypothetical protein
MPFTLLLSLVLLIGPMSARPARHGVGTPTLIGVSVSIETVSKSDEDAVSLGVSIRTPQDRLIATQQIKGVWYEGSSFESILGPVAPALKSEFANGDVTVSPSRPLSQDWGYHCYVTFVFSDRSVITIGWRDVKLKAGAHSVTHHWRVANCLPGEEPARAADSNCTLQMTFKG